MADTQYTTYTSTAYAKRDVNDGVKNVSPSDSPLYSMVGESTAIARYKENVIDAYSGGTTINALVEGASLSDSTVVARTTNGNYTQIFGKTINVSGTDEAIAKFGGTTSEVEYQVKKAFVELAKDVEYSFLQGTSSAGTTASARKMAGLATIITTNTATASGASSTGTAFESTLNSLFQTMFESGQAPDYVFVEGTVKRRISALTANVTRNVDAEKKTQINSINIYDSDFGVVNIVLDRYVASTQLFAVKLDGIKAAYLRKFTRTELAKTSDAYRVAIVGELTIDVSNQKIGGLIVFS